MDLITSPIKVGSGVWLASRVLVTAGATIGDGCLVSAHSIVKGTLSPGSQLSTSQTLTSRTWESIES
jgi:acetyltransferase-like isoleucine patch superfamily enzyme